jgi:hypothetical protein
MRRRPRSVKKEAKARKVVPAWQRSGGAIQELLRLCLPVDLSRLCLEKPYGCRQPYRRVGVVAPDEAEFRLDVVASGV